MKWNDTVARIVELMFDNVEMNDELIALRDEVMNNCQERYHDLVSSGMAEDDAVAAVVESLRGMEDVVGQYRRRSRPAAEYTPEADGDDASEGPEAIHLVYAPHEVQEIDLTLVSEDVALEPSTDGMYHVMWQNEGPEYLRAQVSGGVLRVTRAPDADRQKMDGHTRRTEYSYTFPNGGKSKRVWIDGQEIDAEAARLAEEVMKNAEADMRNAEEAMKNAEETIRNAGGIMESLGRMLGGLFGGIKRSFGGCERVTIQVPAGAAPRVKLTTTSGDLNVADVALSALTITTTSGDISVCLNEGGSPDRAEMRTTSGDIDATLFVREANLSSVSGDVEAEGRIGSLSINTVSGDIAVRADVAACTFKAISGDVNLTFDSDEIREVSGSTISGDVEARLPQGLGSMGITTRTRSGDVTTRYSVSGAGPAVTGQISTMSGDITIK